MKKLRSVYFSKHSKARFKKKITRMLKRGDLIYGGFISFTEQELGLN